MRIPRKLKKKIPEGLYCYKFLKPIIEGNIWKGYTIKLCEFFNVIKLEDKPKELQDEIDKEFPKEKVGWCKYLQSEIEDQCKSCGINKGKLK